MATYDSVNGHEPPNGQSTNNEKASQPEAQPHAHHAHHISDFIPHHHQHVPHGIHEDGESGRKGLTPHFFKIVLRSSCVPSALCNILWPFVPLGIVFSRVDAINDNHKTNFALLFLGMIPAANLLGFAGQELARKLPKVFGMVLETFLGGIVEMVLFTVLIVQSDKISDVQEWEEKCQGGAHKRAEASASDSGVSCDRTYSNLVPVIQAAILGSVLANLLLILGLCFVAGGVRHASQKFNKEISETGSGLLLMAAFALTVPRAFGFSLQNAVQYTPEFRMDLVTKISRAGAIILIIAYFIYIAFQMFSHHGVISEIFEEDEMRDRDRHRDLAKDKLTLTECLVAIVCSVALVSTIAVLLVLEIEKIIHYDESVSDMLMGLILVPLVEKFAEGLTVIDEAWDNTMNLSLAHVLGATLQTVLFNTGLVVVVGWCLNKDMNLDFVPFHIIIVVLAILAVGSFLRDGESTWLEGSICVLIYFLITVCAYYYPNVSMLETEAFATTSDSTSTTAAAETAAATATEAAHKMMKMMMRT